MLRLLLIIGALASLSPVQARAAPGPADRSPHRIALVPFMSLARPDPRASLLMAEIAAVLTRQGYEVVAGEAVEEVLEAERVRYVDSLPAPALKRLLEATGAGGVVVGGYLVAEPASPQPTIAADARLVSAEGKLLWSGAAALTPADTEKLFGLGRRDKVEGLVRVTSRRLLESFPRSGETVRGRSRTAGDRTRPRAHTGRALRPGTVFMLPLDNFSGDRTAPRTIEALVLTRLGGHRKLAVIEPGDMRRAIVAEQIHSIYSFTPRQQDRLRERLGAAYFMRGAIFSFGVARDALGRTTPEVSLSLELVDATTGTVVWSTSHARTGASYETVMGLGVERSVFGVADGVVSEMIRTISDP